MGLGSKVRAARAAKGWTLDQLAEVSLVQRGTISALENRDSSRSEHFPALAKALSMTVEQLAAYDDNGAQPPLIPAEPADPEALEAGRRALDEALSLLAHVLQSVDSGGRDFASLALQKFARDPQVEKDRTLAMLITILQSSPNSPDPEPSGTRGKAKSKALTKTGDKASLVLKLGGGQRQMFTVPMQPLRKAIDNRNASKREREWYAELKAAPKAAN